MSSSVYDAAQCCAFLKTNEVWGSFGNMASGYPLLLGLEGIIDAPIPHSEGLYQACKYPGHPEVQKAILSEKNAFKSKLIAKKYRELEVYDWVTKSIAVMGWAIKVKVINHPEHFRRRFDATEGKPIVEVSSKRDTFWGTTRVTQESGPDLYVGQNVLGRIWMQVRQQVLTQGHLRLPPVSINPLNGDYPAVFQDEPEARVFPV